MTKLNEMWDKLSEWQPEADKRGYGGVWIKMCKLRTVKACRDADAYTADYATADDDDDDAAGYAAAAAADAAADASRYAEYWAQKAINYINKAIELNKGK
tara:strand:+ start:268 stop:567 length:300 start_codon:yes stop_codon:yes gene_type:complete